MTPEHIKLKFPLAGLGSRSAALLFDVFILALFYAALIALLFWAGEEAAPTDDAGPLGTAFIVTLIIINFIIVWGYFALFEFFSRGRTLGKMLLGLRVIQENGQSLTFLSAFIRNLLRIIDFLPGFFFLGILLIFLHPKHKRLGDIASGTIVVYEHKRKNKHTIEKGFLKRFGALEPLTLDDWSKQKFTSKDWRLLKTYIERQVIKNTLRKTDVTEKVARILLPKAGLEVNDKTELEKGLARLYLTLKDEYF